MTADEYECRSDQSPFRDEFLDNGLMIRYRALGSIHITALSPPLIMPENGGGLPCVPPRRKFISLDQTFKGFLRKRGKSMGSALHQAKRVRSLM